MFLIPINKLFIYFLFNELFTRFQLRKFQQQFLFNPFFPSHHQSWPHYQKSCKLQKRTIILPTTNKHRCGYLATRTERRHGASLHCNGDGINPTGQESGTGRGILVCSVPEWPCCCLWMWITPTERFVCEELHWLTYPHPRMHNSRCISNRGCFDEEWVFYNFASPSSWASNPQVSFFTWGLEGNGAPNLVLTPHKTRGNWNWVGGLEELNSQWRSHMSFWAT